MPISQLLRHFQKSHQLMAMVVDEHGTVVGIVTLENVLEQIIGSVEDEFDTETPDIERDGDGSYLVQGSASLGRINKEFGLQLDEVLVSQAYFKQHVTRFQFAADHRRTVELQKLVRDA